MASNVSVVGPCQTCGGPITGSRSGQAPRKFCSYECAYKGRSTGQEAQRAKLAASHRVCERCGTEFTPNSNRQKFCSSTCKVTNETERGLAQRHARVFRCERCGAEFHRDSNNYRQIYCSDECRLANKRETRSTFDYERVQSPEHVAKRVAAVAAAFAQQVRICERCDAEFTPSSGGQRYCSGQCWNAVAAKRRGKRDRPKISPEQYRALSEQQNGLCGICHQINGAGHRLAADHDHKTGAIRGLLCHRCNTAVGLLRDDPALLQAAIEYLTSHT